MVRALLAAAIAASILVWPVTPVRAQDTSAAGSLGAGMFGPNLTTTVDLGVDLIGEELALGVGARLRWVGSGFRGEDWDDRSDLGRLVRYLAYVRRAESDGDVEATVIGGPLGDATLGHGAIVGGFATGLDVDHQRLGVHARSSVDRYGVEAILDDAVAPRIGAVRGSIDVDAVVIGASIAVDGSAPVMDSTDVLTMLGVDVEKRFTHPGGRRALTAYADFVSAVGTATGLHLGLDADFTVGERDVELGARIELRGGTSRYVPAWVGPLYDVARHGRLDAANTRDLGGVGGLVAGSVSVPRLGGLDLSYAARAGLPDLMIVRVSAPYFRDVQAAVWTAAEVGAGGTGAFAAEVRARLPERLFVTLEAARLFQMREMTYEPLWIVTASLGAVLGE